MGKLAQIKTKETAASVADFINHLDNETQRDDSRVLLALMEELTGQAPKMWGAGMIGFGNLRYESPATGRQVDWFVIGFAPRKTNLTIYFNGNLQQYAKELGRIGKYKSGKGCLYVNKLADIDISVLAEMLRQAVAEK